MSSWLTAVENQAANTKIKSNTAARIVQDFMQANWDYSEINGNDIGWGYPGSLLGTRSGKSITLRCIPVIDSVRKEDVTRRLMRFVETVRIDVYLRDETAPVTYTMSEKLEGMVRYIQGFIEANMNALYVQGISGMENLFTQAIPADPGNPNSKIYHAIVTIHVWYRMINEHDASV
jgi:hypothetical protein